MQAWWLDIPTQTALAWKNSWNSRFVDFDEAVRSLVRKQDIVSRPFMTSRYVNALIDNDMTMNDFSPDASQVAEVGNQAELTLRALQIGFYCAVQRSKNAC